MRRFGSYGLNEGQFNGCAGIAYNRNKQQIVVTDRFNNRIEFFDLEGNFIKAFGGPVGLRSGNTVTVLHLGERKREIQGTDGYSPR